MATVRLIEKFYYHYKERKGLCEVTFLLSRATDKKKVLSRTDRREEIRTRTNEAPTHTDTTDCHRLL